MHLYASYGSSAGNYPVPQLFITPLTILSGFIIRSKELYHRQVSVVALCTQWNCEGVNDNDMFVNSLHIVLTSPVNPETGVTTQRLLE